MKLFKHIVLRHSTDIITTPDRIWDFFVKMEDNYTTWHPDDHVSFRWTNGNPMEEGSVVIAEEYMHGELHKIKMTCTEVEPDRKFVLKSSFPLSFIFPRSEYLLEQKGEVTTFTAVNHLRIGRLFYMLAGKKIDAGIADAKRHIREEGENLKRILEPESRAPEANR